MGDTWRPDNAAAIAQESLARSREFFLESTITVQNGARFCAEIAETTWASARLLNDKIARDAAWNTEALFRAAEACVEARSPDEMAKVQTDYLRMLFATTTEQARELMDLSVRASQHVLEKIQEAADRLMRIGS